MDDQVIFENICGDCAGVDITDITEEDVRKQAEYYKADEESIKAAIRHLEYLKG